MDWDLFERIEVNDAALEAADSPGTPVTECFSCHSSNIHFMHEDGRFVCANCGMVLCVMMETNIANGIAERQNDGSGVATTSSPISIFLPKSSLGTTVKGNCRMKVRVVNGWLKWIYKERTFYQDTRFITEKCYAAKINQAILDTALRLYKETCEKNRILRGARRTGTMAACVYYGAKLQHHSFSPIEVSHFFDIPRQCLSKGCAVVNELLNIDRRMQQRGGAVDFVERFSPKMGMTTEQCSRARDLALQATAQDIAGNFQPPSIAAALLLLVGDNKNKEEISRLTGISAPTIHKASKELEAWFCSVSK